MLFSELINSIDATRRNDFDYRCKCPAHNGTSDDSLSISPGDNDIALLYCHAGCTYEEIAKSLGLDNPTTSHPPPKKSKNEIVAVYSYTNEDGKVLFEKIRLEPKSFRVRVPNGNGYDWKIGDTRRVLYNLPAVIAADTIYIVEGEKDADRLNEAGLVATCNFDGASKAKQKQKWNDDYNEFFYGKTVYIIPDNDEPGHEHASFIKRSLFEFAKSIKIIELPDLMPGGDVSDWLNQGHTIDDLKNAASNETPDYKWQVFTLKDARKPREPRKWLIDGIIQESSLNMVYGAPGTYKSMVLVDMCCTMAAGGRWLPDGELGYETRKTPILWIDYDNGSRETHERFDAFSKTRNLPDDAPINYVTMSNPMLNLSDINSIIDLECLINDTGAEFVVIDNLGIVKGDVDENAAVMAVVMANVRGIVERTGAAVTLIHHQRKGGANGSRAGDAIRGHSSIEAALSLALHISRKGQKSQIAITPTKVRGPQVPTINAEFYAETNLDGSLDNAWFYGKGLISETGKVANAIRYILEREKSLVKTKLANEVKSILGAQYGVNSIRAEIDNCLAHGVIIKEEKGEKASKIITLI